jgi:hypothetical protein
MSFEYIFFILLISLALVAKEKLMDIGSSEIIFRLLTPNRSIVS